jgi:hypothetical protein
MDRQLQPEAETNRLDGELGESAQYDNKEGVETPLWEMRNDFAFSKTPGMSLCRNCIGFDVTEKEWIRLPRIDRMHENAKAGCILCHLFLSKWYLEEYHLGKWSTPEHAITSPSDGTIILRGGKHTFTNWLAIVASDGKTP